jgi:hypothetical protein
MPSIGIVYGEQSGIVRHIIIPDNDAGLRNVVLQPGEAIVAVDRLKFKKGSPDTNDAIAAVEEVRGKPSDDPRCVVVDAKGVVVDVLLADPLIDSDPKGSLVRDATAVIGDVVALALELK